MVYLGVLPRTQPAIMMVSRFLVVGAPGMLAKGQESMSSVISVSCRLAPNTPAVPGADCSVLSECLGCWLVGSWTFSFLFEQRVVAISQQARQAYSANRATENACGSKQVNFSQLPPRCH